VFYYLYLIIATIVYIVATVFLLFFIFKSKYRYSIPARFFLFNNSPLKEDGIWFHVCSYGEARSIGSIVDKIKSSSLRFTTTTQTGYEVISSYSKESRYLPFEIFLPFWSKRQKALVVFEAELWYMLFISAKAKGAKTFLINARLSEKSFPKYKRFKFLYSQIFKNIDSVYAQSYDDARRLKALGAHNIKVIGNIKFANLPKATKDFAKNYELILTAGSTHEGEEELILDAFLTLKRVQNAQLIVVPRHPERFDSVATLLEKECLKSGLTFSRYSNSREFNSDIVLIDVMGELINAYAISDIVILGGAFANVGGHNAAEAAQFGCKIITGVNYFNQVELFKSVEGLTIIKDSELKDKLLDYMALPNCKIDSKSDITPLIEDLKSVL